ncbi:MAG TPA: hypothetical protein PLW02_11755, partial [Verrucomicrobiota bacterium]|nr:hypothetical protein [Verrucomicrobiota bacterium]
NLTSEKRLNTLLTKIKTVEYRGEEVIQRVGRVHSSAIKSLNAISKGGGTVLGALAILNVVSQSNHAAETALLYAKNRQEGNLAFADLDAIDIAVSIQDATGNYFVTMYALDILIDDD